MAASGKNPKKRNSLAGSTKGTSKSARYFQTHPKARANKDKINTEIGKKDKQKKERAEHKRANTKNPNKKGQDKSRQADGSFKNESESKNRARKTKRVAKKTARKTKRATKKR